MSSIKKDRTRIDDDLAAKIRYEADGICCICNIPGKNCQIHHIDEDPSNNVEANLAWICMDDHSKIHSKQAFARNYTRSDILKYKTEWLKRVQERRKERDRLDLQVYQLESNSPTLSKEELKRDTIFNVNDFELNRKGIEKYLFRVADIKIALLKSLIDEFLSEVNNEYIRATYEMRDFYEGVLVGLSEYYPTGHFNGHDPKLFFNEYINSVFNFNYLLKSPRGERTEGSMGRRVLAFIMMQSVEQMVTAMVNALCIETGIDYKEWEAAWNNSKFSEKQKNPIKKEGVPVSSNELPKGGIPATYQGGETAWIKYLELNLDKNVPVRNGALPGTYTVVVSFLIGKDGQLSEVSALNDPGYGTAEEALRVIKNSPRWISASLNGEPIIYRLKQGVTFKVGEL